MYKVKVNDAFNFEISLSQNEVQLAGQPIELDIANLGKRSQHLLHNNISYNIEILELDKETKTAHISINGNSYSVNIKDKYDELLAQLGMDNLTNNKIQQIKAPMPGLVLNILTSEGDEVKKGDNILVLEAMKMENMIKSPTDGTIHKIEVEIGDKVEKNELLIKFT